MATLVEEGGVVLSEAAQCQVTSVVRLVGLEVGGVISRRDGKVVTADEPSIGRGGDGGDSDKGRDEHCECE